MRYSPDHKGVNHGGGGREMFYYQGILRVFLVLNFKIILSKYTKKNLVGILVGTALNLCINLGGTDIFTQLHLSIHVYVSIYLNLWCHSSAFCSFQHTGP